MGLQVLALDLQDEPEKVAAYEAHHRAVWPGVLAHLRRHGITEMQIYRLGTRLVMLMHTDDAVFNAEALRAAAAADPLIAQWEALMWQFQAPTPWTPAGEKWVPMAPIFSLRDS